MNCVNNLVLKILTTTSMNKKVTYITNGTSIQTTRVPKVVERILKLFSLFNECINKQLASIRIIDEGYT